MEALDYISASWPGILASTTRNLLQVLQLFQDLKREHVDIHKPQRRPKRVSPLTTAKLMTSDHGLLPSSSCKSRPPKSAVQPTLAMQVCCADADADAATAAPSSAQSVATTGGMSPHLLYPHSMSCWCAYCEACIRLPFLFFSYVAAELLRCPLICSQGSGIDEPGGGGNVAIGDDSRETHRACLRFSLQLQVLSALAESRKSWWF